MRAGALPPCSGGAALSTLEVWILPGIAKGEGLRCVLMRARSCDGACAW